MTATPPSRQNDNHAISTLYYSLCKIKYSFFLGLDGALIITTPQEVALLDVRKEVDFCKKVNLPILGFVENMSSFKCGKCAHESIIWPALSGIF